MIFGAKEFRKADAYKRRQAEKHQNSAILGRLGLFVFAYYYYDYNKCVSN